MVTFEFFLDEISPITFDVGRVTVQCIKTASGTKYTLPFLKNSHYVKLTLHQAI